jgi:hypothetical protein
MGEPAPEEGADNSIDVTINVTNVEEMGTVTLDSDQPMLGTALTASVTDPDVADQGTVMWQWASSATMAGPFTEISGATTDASYTPVAGDAGMYLQATATYDDGEGSGKMAMAVSDNMVVSFSAPAFAADAATTLEVAENTAAGMNIGGPFTAMDADGDDPVYSLSGTSAASFDINTGTGQLMTMAALDFETKATYAVTVEVSDNEDAMGNADTAVDDRIDVTITVTNVEEMGTVTLDSDQPRVGTALTASVTDPDVADQGTVMWQWASSATMAGPFTEISGDTVMWQWASSATMGGAFGDIAEATGASYTPVAGDAGMYLQATATYDDGEGSGKMAMEATANAVSATPTTGSVVGDQYDANDNGVIDLEEVYKAIDDYFDDLISLEEVYEIIALYF